MSLRVEMIVTMTDNLSSFLGTLGIEVENRRLQVGF